MKAEQNELYNYTTDHYEDELNKITKDSVSPIIAIRQVVKKAMNQYEADYCGNSGVFTQDDFSAVVKRIQEDKFGKENTVKTLQEQTSLSDKDKKVIEKNYNAFISNFENIDIVPWVHDKGYCINTRNAREEQVTIQYCDSIDYVNGWLYGAVQAKCKMIKER